MDREDKPGKVVENKKDGSSSILSSIGSQRLTDRIPQLVILGGVIIAGIGAGIIMGTVLGEVTVLSSILISEAFPDIISGMEGQLDRFILGHQTDVVKYSALAGGVIGFTVTLRSIARLRNKTST